MGYVGIAFEGRWLRVVPPVTTGEALLRADAQAPDAGAVLERVELAHGRVALRTADGRYLARHAVHGAPSALELVTELTPCAAFEELPLPDGSVALRGCDLRFLGVHSSGAVVADRVTDGSRERFHWLDVPAPSAEVVRLPLQAGSPCASPRYAGV